MATILTVRGKHPAMHASVWLAPNATVVGDVVLGASSTVWFQAVVRGDVSPIEVGQRVNIQDLSLIHI